MLTRRKFVHRSALLSLSPAVPAFLSQSALAAKPIEDEHILVVIQLSGGNDGLNTVIPFRDEDYPKYRRHLRVNTKDVIKLNDSIGFHPGMKAAAELFDAGRLAVVQGVGYPNPNRSHFRSMAIWHSARLDQTDDTGQGWLGRAADATKPTSTAAPDAVFVGDAQVPTAIVGRRSTAVALNNEDDMTLTTGISRPNDPSTVAPQSFVQATLDMSFVTAQRLAEATDIDRNGTSDHPNSQLSRRLRLIAKLIRMKGGTRIFYVEQPGYDTHSAQKIAHERLLREFSSSLKAFLDDMKASGLSERLIVLAFSEFGRRVEENASAGTDHGTSGPVFVAGDSVRPGLLGTYPALADLDDGDLKSTVDFRRVYASLLTGWMGIEAIGPLGGRFEPLQVIAS